MNTHIISELALERMVRAVEKVRDRLRRSTQALAKAGIPYAVVGGNAVAAWVSEVDEAAVRNTRNVDILLRRSEPRQGGDGKRWLYLPPFQEHRHVLGWRRREGP